MPRGLKWLHCNRGNSISDSLLLRDVDDETDWETDLIKLFTAMRHALALAALVVTTTPASAQYSRSGIEYALIRPYAVIPPAEFDRPYKGKLTIIREPDLEKLRKQCSPTASPLVGASIGCAHHDDTSCTVYLASDDAIRARGFTSAIVLRHEIGHCNGWPGGHPRARTLVEAERQ